MWGTIARMRVRPGAEQFLFTQFHSMRNAERMPGWLFTHLFRADTDPREYWMVAMFTDKEAYQRNAESPGQNQVYLLIRSCLEADPEWHDVEEADLVSGVSDPSRQRLGDAPGSA